MAASTLLGIGRKTSYRWRAEDGGLPPARLAESSRSSRFLALLERQRIAARMRTSSADAHSGSAGTRFLTGAVIGLLRLVVLR